VDFRWSVILEYRETLWWGIVETAKISVVSALFALILGTAVGISRADDRPLFRWLGGGYVELFRNIPVLVHMMIFYFAFGFNSFWAAVVGLSLYTGGYVAETVRAGITAVSRGQTEAGLATGLSRMQVQRTVVLPQAFMYAIPPLTTEMLNVLKNSSVAMAVGAQELTFSARNIESFTFRGVEAATAATGLYIGLSALIIAGAYFVERLVKVRGRVGQIAGRSQIEE
jgi:His/Glu/Gln/Arg/opine family amino acid ABC transporter permease subunit